MESYHEVVKVFVTSGNKINDYDIKSIEQSKFAFPKEKQSLIRGETKMSWTDFVGIMEDGNQFAFGSIYNWEFFEMPEGYESNDIEEIINNSYLDENGILKSYYSKDPIDFGKLKIYRQRPFFECFVDGL